MPRTWIKQDRDRYIVVVERLGFIPCQSTDSHGEPEDFESYADAQGRAWELEKGQVSS